MRFSRHIALLLLALMARFAFADIPIVTPTAPSSWDPTVVQSPDRYRVGSAVKGGVKVDIMVVPGRPPDNFRILPVAVPQPNVASGINVLPDTPAFDWSYGCSATSASMMMGYYDRMGYGNMYAGPTNGGICPLTNEAWGTGECPLSATHQGYDGRAIRGHVDDYWISYGSTAPDPYIGNWTPHPNGDCLGDYMGTNQSALGCTDGATYFYFASLNRPLNDYTGCEPGHRDGCHGLRLYATSRGYTVVTNYSQYIRGYHGISIGFTFDQYCAEIDAGRPVLIQVSGHTMLGYGYNKTGQIVYVHDTWDYSSHEMVWGGSYAGMQHYGVTVFSMGTLPVNRPPIAMDAAYTTTQDTPCAATLTATDPDNDPITYTIASPPAHGHLSGTAPQLTYTPDPQWTGIDSFTFTAADATSTSAAATVTITVSPKPQAPIAFDSTVTTNQNTKVSGTLQASDSSNSQLTFSIVKNGTLGTATITNSHTGAFSYTPKRNAGGIDTFTFRVYNGTAYSNVATVTVYINRVPTAQNASFSTTRNIAVAGILSASDADNNPLTFSLVRGGRNGTVTITNAVTGAFLYTPRSGYTGSDTFTFRVYDGWSYSNTATITINIRR